MFFVTPVVEQWQRTRNRWVSDRSDDLSHLIPAYIKTYIKVIWTLCLVWLQDRTHASLSGMYNHVIVCLFVGPNPCQPVWYVQPRDCLSVYRTGPMPVCLVCTTMWLSVCLQDRTHASLSGMYNHVIVCLFTGPKPCQSVWYVQPCDCLSVCRTEPMPACLVCTTTWLSVCL